MSDQPSTIPSTDGEVYKPAYPSGYPHISYGMPFHLACAKHIKETFQAQRGYIIASASLSRNTNYITLLQETLGNKHVGTRIGMKPHTYWSEILEIAKEVKELEADLLVTVGAGSLTDGAKVIALALVNNALDLPSLSTLASNTSWTPTSTPSSILPPSIPIISIPTSLSGGEYSLLGGATHDETLTKHPFGHPNRGPALVVLDAQLTTTTPDSIWLQSGVRAIDHCVEGMCSLPSTSESDGAATAGLRELIPGLLRCKSSKQDLEARHACQMGVIGAMSVVFQHGVPMGASHGIGHQLGPMGVGHGETSCILLPAVCKYNESVNGEQQGRVREVFWEVTEARELFERKGLKREEASLGEMLDVFIRELGMPRSLKDVGVGEEKFGVLAENALMDKWCGTNPRPLETKEDVLEIIEMVKG
ncbi:putative alcohol dehydrogenase, iron-type/glycerol dehydrogenase GldA [Septoria linicola]|nr:putative alcohol dehydrogenase, iron-type/glycerol dehydrogenase GldA [Septoria linicola]